MKFHIEGPPSLEVLNITTTDRSLDIQPLTVRGQHVMRVGYVTATGENGTEAKAVVLFNGNTGEFSIQRLDVAPVIFAFDKTPSDFAARREAAKSLVKNKTTKPTTAAAQSAPPAAGTPTHTDEGE